MATDPSFVFLVLSVANLFIRFSSYSTPASPGGQGSVLAVGCRRCEADGFGVRRRRRSTALQRRAAYLEGRAPSLPWGYRTWKADGITVRRRGWNRALQGAGNLEGRAPSLPWGWGVRFGTDAKGVGNRG